MFFEATRYFSSFDEIGLSRVESCCFEHTGRLEEEAISCEARDGLLPTAWSRRDIPIDCRYLDFSSSQSQGPRSGSWCAKREGRARRAAAATVSALSA